MGNLLSDPDGEPEMLFVQAFVYLSHLSPLNCGRSLPNLGLGSCLLVCARRSAGGSSISTTFQLLHSLHQMPVRPILSSFEDDSA
jgi:hypothetical protein